MTNLQYHPKLKSLDPPSHWLRWRNERFVRTYCFGYWGEGSESSIEALTGNGVPFSISFPHDIAIGDF